MLENTVEGLYIAVLRAACIKHTTPAEAHQVLFEYGRHDTDKGFGYPGGKFTRALLNAISKADSHNQARLGMGFPGYVAACQVAQEDPQGIKLLKEIIVADRMAEGLDELEFKREQGAPREAGSQS